MDTGRLLAEGSIDILGRMPYSSNGTFLVEISCDDEDMKAIYKPLRGERPLWDFPSGLYRREIAAYQLSELLGLHIVPMTVEREGPLGSGSVQAFIEARFEEHYFTLFHTRPDLHDQFRAIALFDFVANNTDRKSGHCLIDSDDKIWAIDNGLCFSPDFKLRTVIWEFAGEPIESSLMDAMTKFAHMPLDVLKPWLDDEEIDAVIERAQILISDGTYPLDPSGSRYPWPMV